MAKEIKPGLFAAERSDGEPTARSSPTETEVEGLREAMRTAVVEEKLERFVDEFSGDE